LRLFTIRRCPEISQWTLLSANGIGSLSESSEILSRATGSAREEMSVAEMARSVRMELMFFMAADMEK